MGVKRACFPSVVVGPCVVGSHVVTCERFRKQSADRTLKNVVQLVAVVVIVGVIEGLILTFGSSRAYNRGYFYGGLFRHG